MEASSQIAAIVSEYNPFHNGHVYHIQETRKLGATHIVAVMSGDFVQRGAPAILSKWARAEMALRAGVDLVVELLLPWAMATAERFAFGAMSLIEDMGCVDFISFGSEIGDISSLIDAARMVDSPRLSDPLHRFLEQGMTYAKARELAMKQVFGNEPAQLLRAPNNILGIEYLRALKKLNSSVSARTVGRVGVSHDQIGVAGSYASASQIREFIQLGSWEDSLSYLPPDTIAILQREQGLGYAPASLSNLERAILTTLRTMNENQFRRIPDVREGLEYRIVKAVKQSCSLDEVIKNIKTKRYTHARIRRIILSAYLNLTTERIPDKPPYFRILGIGKNGAAILNAMKRRAALPILVRAKDSRKFDEKALSLWHLEGAASDLYGLSTPVVRPCGLNATTQVIVR